MINLLSAYLKAQQTGNYHDSVHGVLRTAKEMADGKLLTYPISLDNTDCSKNAAILPNSKVKSISWHESVTGRVEIYDRLDGGHPRYKTLLSYVFWCDPRKINNIESLLIDYISMLEWNRHEKLVVNNTDVRIHAIQCQSIETDPLKVFSKYNYRTSGFMFENPPFCCFSIQMLVVFNAKCNPIELSPEC